MHSDRHMDAIATWLATTCEQIAADTVDAVIREANQTAGQRSPDPQHWRARARELVQSQINRAIAERPPKIVFRPIVHLESGAFIAHEAIAQREADDDGQRRPHAMAGLRAELELGAIRATLREIDHLPRAAFICVAVSAELLGDARLHELIARSPCDRLVVEIDGDTDSNDQELRTHLDAIRNFGARVAVNGIGTGASSPRRVAAFEPEILKIDVSNAQRLASDHHHRELVSDTVRMARQFGAFVVAEGIESSEQISVALELGVDAGQGLLLDTATSLTA